MMYSYWSLTCYLAAGTETLVITAFQTILILVSLHANFAAWETSAQLIRKDGSDGLVSIGH